MQVFEWIRFDWLILGAPLSCFGDPASRLHLFSLLPLGFFALLAGFGALRSVIGARREAAAAAPMAEARHQKRASDEVMCEL